MGLYYLNQVILKITGVILTFIIKKIMVSIWLLIIIIELIVYIKVKCGRPPRLIPLNMVYSPINFRVY